MRICAACGLSHRSDEAACPACGWQAPMRNGFCAYAPEVDAALGAGFRPEAFADLAAHEDGSFWFQARNRLILAMVARHAPGFRSMLEIGCGTGFVLRGLMERFAGARFTGSEVYSAGLAFAAARAPGATLCQMDARRIGHVDEFDLIGAFDVLEHIEEDTQVLAEIRQALVPGGVLIVTVPQHPWLWSPADEYACHARRYARGEMEAKIAAAGLKVVRSTSFVSLLLPAMLLSRVVQRLRPAAEFDPTAEFRLHPALNATFGAVMRIEEALIRFGAALPLGGSRLVVARKEEVLA